MANGLFNLKQVMQAIQQSAWVSQKTPAVEYLVVAGGGGGGGYYGAGGGGGGLLQGLDPVPNGQTLLVTVGGGGTGSGNGYGTNGQNSVFGSITASGGGGGAGGSASSVKNGLAGGSGGGGQNYDAGVNFASGGSAVFGQGNIGSSGVGGGGGGAGAPGYRGGAINFAGGGGVGAASAISGALTTYAGGGAGAGGSFPGGAGGGGAANVNGTPNTGGGGGGDGGTTGGSGIVIVSYPDVYAAATTVNATASTSGSGSLSFNGSTQFISYGDQTAFEFGSGDFTIEVWVYVTALTGGNYVVGKYRPGFVADSDFLLYIPTDGSVSMVLCSTSPSNDETVISAPAGTVTTNTWISLAVTRNSNTVRVFKNGSVVASSAYSRTVNASSYPLGVGGLTSGVFNGYISNLRIIKGTGLYTGTYTVSTTPLTVVSGTSLLLKTVSGSPLLDSSTNCFAPTSATVAPSWNQQSPFATGLGYKNRVYTWTTSGSITF